MPLAGPHGHSTPRLMAEDNFRLQLACASTPPTHPLVQCRPGSRAATPWPPPFAFGSFMKSQPLQRHSYAARKRARSVQCSAVQQRALCMIRHRWGGMGACPSRGNYFTHAAHACCTRSPRDLAHRSAWQPADAEHTATATARDAHANHACAQSSHPAYTHNTHTHTLLKLPLHRQLQRQHPRPPSMTQLRRHQRLQQPPRRCWPWMRPQLQHWLRGLRQTLCEGA
jgi:hypothetical protein